MPNQSEPGQSATGQCAHEAIVSVGANGHVSTEDVLFLRRNVFADGVVSTSELDALFALGERAPEGDPEWADFFAEAAADFYLREEEPRGYLTEGEFTGLKARVTRDGARASALEVGLLVKLLETAVSTPHAMVDFVAEQLKRVVTEKEGGARVSKSDADLVRRFLFAAGGHGNVAVTKEEAELLFDLNDATASAENDPAWVDLFIKGVANHLMAHIGYTPPAREEALRLHAWAEDRSVDLGGFFKKMFSGGLAGVRESYARQTVMARRNDDNDIAMAIAEKVTAREADWLAARIGRDGQLHESERALIAYMRDLEAELPPKLKALVEQAA